MLKKQISLLLSMLLILSSVGTIAYAADDAAGLNYKAEVLVYDSNGSPMSSFEIGDKIRVDVVLNSTGVATAPLYAIQGKLEYDSSYLLYKDVQKGANVTSSVGNNIFAFGFLDKKVEGIKVSNPFVIASVTFEALQNGTTKLMFSKFDITNSDGSKRKIDYSSFKELKLGTGIHTENKPALFNLIKACKIEIEGVIVSTSSRDVSKQSFWVKQEVYDKFNRIINAALTVYQNDVSSTEEVSAAQRNLESAKEEFIANKSSGTKASELSIVETKHTVIITATASEHGQISNESISQKVAANTSVTIVSIPDEGYEVDKVYVNGEEFNGEENFTIPKVTNDSVVKVTFRWKNIFLDVSEDDWFYDSVMFLNEKGLMNGTSEAEFEPNISVTRGMFVTVLHRMEKEPAADLSRFADVKAENYFAKAVGWASMNEIVNGISETEFAPNADVTREQMVTILYRYANVKKYDTSPRKDISKFVDGDKVSNYAKEAMAWAIECSIIKGKGENQIDPQGNATRAEIATALQRVIIMIEATNAAETIEK